MDYKLSLFQFLGGLGIFLFSIKYMGDGLQLSAGDKLRNILDKYTTNPFLGVLTGVIVTVLLQSSSGTTVIVVGLVGAGLLNLKQAIGIIMGANIGTTLTTFIIGFNLSQYALPIIFLGAALLFFTKIELLNNIGRIFYGFGGIFFALNLMGSAMQAFKHQPWFTQLMIDLAHNPILGVSVGTVLTMLIQASSATISIIQNLYADGIISLNASLPVLFGDNIGTTITAILACLGASVVAKRVALSHVLFNVIGTIIFLIFLAPFTYFIATVQAKFNLAPKLTIAFAHAVFNTANTIILFPFISQLAYIVTKAIPSSNEEEEIYKPQYIDEKLLYTAPSIAIANAKNETVVMYKKAIANVLRSTDFFHSKDKKVAEKVLSKEDEINTLDQEIAKYLTGLFRQKINIADSDYASYLLDATRDIERIADHAAGLVRDIQYQIKKSMVYSEDARYEVTIFTNMTLSMLNLSLEAFAEGNKNKAIESLDFHNRIHAYEKKARKKHIQRLNNGKCEVKAGLYYVDVISHFSRMADHARNVSEKVINDQL